MTKQIHCQDNIELLQGLKDNSVSGIVTDIPYALDKIDAKAMIYQDANNTKGFMGKAWDTLPTKDFLSECLRVLKDGSWFVTTFIPRLDLQTVFVARLIEVGFDCSYTPIYWNFNSGFPKANNISRKIDKQKGLEGKWSCNGEQHITQPTVEDAIYCNGLYGGYQPKPAVEVILCVMKPHKSKSQVEQAKKWYNERKALLEQGITEEELYKYTTQGTGGSWLDNARIPIADETQDTQGRFAPNLLVSDNALDVGREKPKNNNIEINVKIKTKKVYGKFQENYTTYGFPDGGDLSRYYSLDNWTKKHLPTLYKLSKKTLQLEKDCNKVLPMIPCSKPSLEEKNIKLEEFEKKQITDGSIRENAETARKYGANPSIKENTHPTVKAISLYSYLLKLFTREHDLVLEPFCGSGVTAIACELTNRNYIACDICQEYVDIAKARVEFWRKQKDLQEINKGKEKQTDIFDIFDLL
jgi:site-specific DNA-methyltransferase (adenine-specific)